MNREQIAYKKGYRVLMDGTPISKRNQLSGSNCNGYIRLGIRIEGKKDYVMVHRLQAYQKYGDKMFEKGIVVRHLNGNPKDNSWDNIAIGTASQNMMDIPAHIRMAKSLHATSFHRKHDKETIRKYYESNGLSYKKTMEKFNISSKGTLWFILNK